MCKMFYLYNIYAQLLLPKIQQLKFVMWGPLELDVGKQGCRERRCLERVCCQEARRQLSCHKILATSSATRLCHKVRHKALPQTPPQGFTTSSATRLCHKLHHKVFATSSATRLLPLSPPQGFATSSATRLCYKLRHKVFATRSATRLYHKLFTQPLASPQAFHLAASFATSFLSC